MNAPACIALAVALRLLVGCGASGDGTSFVTDPAAWIPVSAEDDPLAGHRPEEPVDCEGWWIEGDLVEVSTFACNYFAVSQEVPQEMPAGSLVRAGLVHDPLFSDQGESSSHVALLAGGEVLWEDTLPVPGLAEFHPIEARLESTLPKGGLLILHLHNHGANTYRWEPVELLPY